MTAGVYLLHFTEPFGHAKHYVGFSENIEKRVALHQQGKGSRLCEVVVKAGIRLLWVRTWVGADRHFERKLHSKGKSIFCPICNKRHWKRNQPHRLHEAVHDNDVVFNRKA